ncbi:MAG: hypothetical protein ABJ205_04530 [Erythrobacter sp.]|uniref:hypothetical protein n=1 Tax=Erythrobacter sp. TaxID=1042 RepID=UPI003266C852
MANFTRLTAHGLVVFSLTACGGSESLSGPTIAVSIPTPTPSPTPTPTPAPTPSANFDYGRTVNSAANAPLASINTQTGELQYALYANHNQTNADHMLPDFSYAGYGGGGVALPTYSSIPVRQTLSPVAGDNRAAIQSAIDAVSALPADSRGIRGAVQLEAGEYEVSGPLEITASGVILRGQGQRASGTVIRATTTIPQSTLITVSGQGGGRLPTAASAGATTSITQSYVPVGTNSVEVADASAYAAGDEIAIVREPNDPWVSAASGLDMAQYGWEPATYELAIERTIVSVSGDTITFDAPVTDTIEAQFGGGYVYKTDTSARLQQVGVENMRLQTLDYDDVSRENRAFFAIDFREVENSWVRDVTSQYFSQAFNFYDGARFNTMQDVAFIDPDFEVVGGQHYAFDFKDAGQNFFQRCYSREGRHSFTSGSRATGPNVFLDCLAENSTNDSGPHHRWATGTLYDNVKDSLLRVQNRTNSGSGHGWAGAQQLLWNSELDEYVIQTPSFAMNWAVGIVGERIDGSFSPNEADGMIQNSGSRVAVRSLYLQQLEDRLGVQAVNNITLPIQRTGPIWSELSMWAGEGKFSP